MATLGWTLKMPTFFHIPNGQVMEIIVMANLLDVPGGWKISNFGHKATIYCLITSHYIKIVIAESLDSVGHQATQVRLWNFKSQMIANPPSSTMGVVVYLQFHFECIHFYINYKRPWIALPFLIKSSQWVLSTPQKCSKFFFFLLELFEYSFTFLTGTQ